jgi:hypothetical protein
LQALALVACGQESLDTDTRREVTLLQVRVETFFDELTDKAIGPPLAVRSLVADGPLRERTEEVARLVDQAAKLELRYGPYRGRDSIDAKNVGADLILLRYLYKAEKFPVVWEFTFYRTDSAAGIKRDWSLIALKFDTKLDGILR